MMNLFSNWKKGPTRVWSSGKHKVIRLVLTWKPGFRAPQVGSDEAKCKSWVTLSASESLGCVLEAI